MKTYDWIVVGAGITGVALAYELAQQGFTVLLLEQHAVLQGSTRYGYGGIAYWAGTTELTRQLCAEGIQRHRSLSEELQAATEFRELDLILTIAPATDPDPVAQSYQQFAIPPQLISGATAGELEPLLNPAAIAAALTVKHGHVNLGALTAAYTQAFQRLGGEVMIAPVTALQRPTVDQVTGVICGQDAYSSGHVAICTGGLTRSLLAAAGIPVRIYFTHAELIEMDAADVPLRSFVMPAVTQRFQLEASASTAELDHLWDQPGHEPAPAILDAGAVQFQDGSLRVGQVSRTLTDLHTHIDPVTSEQAIRTQVGAILPALKDLPGTWHHCLVAFSHDHLPLIGEIPGIHGLQLFSGFSNPLAIVPPLAHRFAAQVIGKEDDLLSQLSPARFN
ncbi:NAD(P)/FAD-dependent oxidoreductase [Pantanalinema sp. GBBB05]|uniref:NAD(P)/FAD-dependent oxidoreductase n=1 Tax=Pantanalinema sp. GBBB05 TaxID=2604139 RepID=UPI001D6DC5C0|nr:FAD-binding oxidoreductase [Pantanalinema sp. GBBB05]